MTSILEGVIDRGTGKKLRDLKVPLAGKTGTTNNNFDAWFIGFSSNLVIGVYIGFDNPKTLGKYETGSKAALPIFKDFVANALYLDDFKEFEIPNNIYLTSLNYDTGLKTTSKDKNIIIEAYSPLVHAKRMDEPRLVKISEELGKTPAQVLIRWAIQREMVVLPKSVNRDRIIENFAVFDFEIPNSVMNQLDDLDERYVTCWDPHNPPPYALV